VIMTHAKRSRMFARLVHSHPHFRPNIALPW